MPTSPTARLFPRLRQAVLASESSGQSDGRLLGEFIRTGDADAFAVLVRRHGPMVLGVCRRMVGDPHLAEDAFQATFLVLARKAASIRRREQIGNWLYGVAYRSATKARQARSRRRVRETQMAVMPHPTFAPPDLWNDLQPVLDAELARLPDRFRLPVVLCDLEGRPQREVARQLGLPPATLANRLAAARRTLAKRLTERGIALSGGAVAMIVSANAAAASVPGHLSTSVVQWAGSVVAGGSMAGLVPAPIVQLSDGVIRMMMLSRLKVAVGLAALVVLSGTLGLTAPAVCAGDDPTSKPAATARPLVVPRNDDEDFLRRICVALRGTPPSPVESSYFLADRDPDRRTKIVTWLVEEEQADRARARNWTNTQFALLALAAAETRPEDVTQHLLLAGHLGLRLEKPEQAEDLEMLRELDAFYLGQAQVQPPEPPDAAVARGLKWLRLKQANEEHRPLSDEAFLQRVCQEAQGREPTRIEREYFLADPEPKKREKLLDALLADPAVLKKLGADWKQKLLDETTASSQQLYLRAARTLALVQRRQVLLDLKLKKAAELRYEPLLSQLLDGKRGDDQVLDALTAAILGRLATESERKLILTGIARQPDRQAAWREVAATLAGTEEAKRYAKEPSASGEQKK